MWINELDRNSNSARRFHFPICQPFTSCTSSKGFTSGLSLQISGTKISFHKKEGFWADPKRSFLLNSIFIQDSVPSHPIRLIISRVTKDISKPQINEMTVSKFAKLLVYYFSFLYTSLSYDGSRVFCCTKTELSLALYFQARSCLGFHLPSKHCVLQCQTG